MWHNLVTKLVLWALKSRITGENKTRLITALLNNINAVPIRDVIKHSRKGIIVNGQILETDQGIAFLQGVTALADSKARKLIRDQILYEAIKLGVNQGDNPDKIMFAKAAIWCLEEEERLIANLTNDA